MESSSQTVGADQGNRALTILRGTGDLQVLYGLFRILNLHFFLFFISHLRHMYFFMFRESS